eukprot:SAG31_NODE_103_length_25164_cov_12.124317_6_plen_138_part_00
MRSLWSSTALLRREFEFCRPLLRRRTLSLVRSFAKRQMDRVDCLKPFCPLRFAPLPPRIMRKPEFFEHRAEEREGRTWGYTTPGIPYIDLINQMGSWLVGGELEVLGPVLYHDGLDEYRKSPAAYATRCKTALPQEP